MSLAFALASDADFILDSLRDASPCPACKAPEPARVDAQGCSECTEYPRCYLCRRWTFGDELIVSLDGAVRGVCSVCWERGEEGILLPLDMEGDDDDR